MSLRLEAVTPTPVPTAAKCDRSDCECRTTDEMVCMRATIPQHWDDHGSKIEDLAGTGECDSLGG